MFSAPASFLAIPDEGVFKRIKLIDFRERKLPDNFIAKGSQVSKLSKKEDLLAQISCYILGMDVEVVKSIFLERLNHLQHFLDKNKV